jgi:hypothetical protein
MNQPDGRASSEAAHGRPAVSYGASSTGHPRDGNRSHAVDLGMAALHQALEVSSLNSVSRWAMCFRWATCSATLTASSSHLRTSSAASLSGCSGSATSTTSREVFRSNRFALAPMNVARNASPGTRKATLSDNGDEHSAPNSPTRLDNSLMAGLPRRVGHCPAKDGTDRQDRPGVLIPLRDTTAWKRLGGVAAGEPKGEVPSDVCRIVSYRHISATQPAPCRSTR